ncbi:MAG: carboxypeptidase regulatory-like domain-containing protein [Myxococcales bacterium]|nr:carboxypeptidase regulatory-like domain-containing protein [Myxococcales bacterium]MCB9756507.1 carboxypeptidase regulatory-like domain-containing protein [Myxococcales bacterium]
MFSAPRHVSLLARRALLVGGAALLLSPGGIHAEEPAAPGTLAGEVSIKRWWRYKKDRSDVVVYLEGVPEEPPTPPSEPHVILQRDKQFTPRVSVVVTGTVIEFPNDDKIFHNVFSLSRAARFDLGLYRSGSSKSVTMKQPGVVDVYCNIHPEMAAKVLVLDTRHYFQTGADGRFSIPELPPGTYVARAWQASGEDWSGEVTIRAGETTQLEIELGEDRRRETHTRKDGTPYGRYR